MTKRYCSIPNWFRNVNPVTGRAGNVTISPPPPFYHSPRPKHLSCQNQSHHIYHKFWMKQIHWNWIKYILRRGVISEELQFRWIYSINHALKVMTVNIQIIIQISFKRLNLMNISAANFTNYLKLALQWAAWDSKRTAIFIPLEAFEQNTLFSIGKLRKASPWYIVLVSK